MATMYITEYANKAEDIGGHPVEAGEELAVTTQKFTFTGTAGASAAFDARTTFIRVYHDHTDTAFTIMGVSPTAVTATGTPIASKSAEFFGVQQGQSLKISAVT